MALLAFIFLQGVAVGFLAADVLEQPNIAEEDLGRQLEGNGAVLTGALWLTGILGTPLILLFAWMRRGIGVRRYLALNIPPLRTLAAWVGIGIALVIITEGLQMLAGKDTVPEFLIAGYRSAPSLPLFWIAVVLWGPLFEEFLFRGFLFRGWSNSRLGANGTILLTATLFTALHQQYDAVQMLIVFLLGILLGLARHRTESLITPLAIHCVLNLIATAQVALLI